jgi:hypothetical protein
MPSMTAEAAVGRDDEASDWQLLPERHASLLPAEAGALRRVLERGEIKGIVAQFRAADAAAVVAQTRYKRIGRLSLYSGTLATVVGALFLLPIDPWFKGVPSAAASTVQILALVVAFLASRLLAVGAPFDKWMKQRAEAEIARVALFDTVSRADEPLRDGELPLLPLKLEYFRRYQLDVERRYYRGRGNEHSAAAWRNNRWLSVSLLFTVAVLAIAVLANLHIAAAWHVPVPPWLLAWFSGLKGPPANQLMLGLGTVASGLYGLGTARSLMDLDERNASRFLTTAENLEFLSAGALHDARKAAAAGRQEDVLAFIERVHQQISSEHREWILLSGREHGPAKLVHALHA